MISEVLNQTKVFLESMPKSVRKKKGQFFTSKESAIFMAGLFDLSIVGEHVEILDPGAGTGILTAAIIERIDRCKHIKSVNITCYETDEIVMDTLKANLEMIQKMSKKKVSYQIVEDDYLLTQSDDFEGISNLKEFAKKYDIVIGNPPYLRVLRKHEAAVALPSIVHGAPNLYFLFAAMSLFNLKDDCEMVYIIPRSWTSGAYFKAFRDYFLTNGKLVYIHLFASRDKVFDQEKVLQETMIVKVKKTTQQPSKVIISSTNACNDFNEMTKITLDYKDVVVGRNLYVFLPLNDYEVGVIRKINKYVNTLPDEGLRMRTGIVVDFRQRNELRKEPGENIVPLFYSQHILEGRVCHHKIDKEYNWISCGKRSSVQKNRNYVFCKRFTAKEERRRLQSGIYLAEDFCEYDMIGTQNKINYVDDYEGNELTKEEVYGIYALLNSTLFDVYYRILNGSTQVNSTEINSIPVPSRNVIRNIGKNLMKSSKLTTEECDRVISVAY